MLASEKPAMFCPICSSDRTVRRRELYDDRHGYPGLFDLYQCRECGHGYLRPALPPETLATLYTEYYPRARFDVSRYCPAEERRGFRSWLRGDRRSAYMWVPQRVRVLDIGCGMAETLGYHRARGCEVSGVEADENVRRIAEAHGFDVHVGLFDPGRYDEGAFDYVTMDQVIEHVQDPTETLRGVARVLKNGGSAVLSTPNIEGWGARLFGRAWINWHAPYHQHLFSARSMAHVAAQAGLVLERAVTITNSDWLFLQWAHLSTRPRPGQPSGFWSPKGQMSLLKRVWVRGLRVLHRTMLDHIITRVFDGLHLGDNFVFILRKP